MSCPKVSPQADGTPQPAETKARLTKDQHEILERHFRGQSKPNTATKKGIAEALGVSLEKINNWFQNRRAKVKQDLKKQGYSTVHAPSARNPLAQQSGSSSSIASHPDPYQQESYSSDDVASSSHPDADTATPRQAEHAVEYGRLEDGTQSESPIETSVMPQSMASQDAIMQSMMGPDYSISIPEDVPITSREPLLGSHNHFYPGDYSASSYAFPSDLSHPFGYGHMFNAIGESPFGYNPYNASIVTSLQTLAPTGSGPCSNTEESTPNSGTKSTSPFTSSASTSDSLLTSSLSQWSDNAGHVFADQFPGQQAGQPTTPHVEQPSSEPSPQLSDAAYVWPDILQATAQGVSEQDSMPQAPDPNSRLVTQGGPAGSQSPQYLTPDDGTPHDLTGIYARRNSSTSALTESMNNVGIHTPQSTGSGFKQPKKQSNIAARRQRPVPSALGPAALGSPAVDQQHFLSGTLRSASYSAALPTSPGASQNLTSDHPLRRIRSSGVSKIQKSNPGSAQRSPLNFTFSDASGPRFMRQMSEFASTNAKYPATAAGAVPLTPLSPDDSARLPLNQRSVVNESQSASSQLNDTSQGGDMPTLCSYANIKPTVTSPPRTPMGVAQTGQHHLPYLTNPLYRDTPPQSAPATQQCFSSMCFVPQCTAQADIGQAGDLTVPENAASGFRRPSLPNFTDNMGIEPQMKIAMPMVNDDGYLQMAYPLQYRQFPVDTMPLFGIDEMRNLSEGFPPPQSLSSSNSTQSRAMSDFTIHQYNPPNRAAETVSARPHDNQPKNYIFANQGPNDFQSS